MILVKNLYCIMAICSLVDSLTHRPTNLLFFLHFVTSIKLRINHYLLDRFGWRIILSLLKSRHLILVHICFVAFLNNEKRSNAHKVIKESYNLLRICVRRTDSQCCQLEARSSQCAIRHQSHNNHAWCPSISYSTCNILLLPIAFVHIQFHFMFATPG